MRPEETTIHVAHQLYGKRIRGALHYHIAAAFAGNTLLCSAINVPGMHAEMCVLRRLEHYATRHRVNWSRVCIVVVRWSACASLHMSKPCVHCMQRLKRSGVGRVCWSNDGGTFDECRTSDLATTHVCGARRSRPA
jgi:hypothetical protein